MSTAILGVEGRGETRPSCGWTDVGAGSGSGKAAGVDRSEVIGSRADDVVFERLGPRGKNELAGLSYDAAGPVGDRLPEPPPSPRLKEHLASVIALMKISGEYGEFERHLDTALPRWNQGGRSSAVRPGDPEKSRDEGPSKTRDL